MKAKLYTLFVASLFCWLALLTSTTLTHAQCSTPSVLAKWDFNDITKTQCNGYVPIKNTAFTTSLVWNPFHNGVGMKSTYCPTINSGCGQTWLGSKGHINTNVFENALCLWNFYAPAAIAYIGNTALNYDPDATVFDPDGKANLYVNYVIPKGKAGCLNSFALTILQKQFDGKTVNFEKQGVAVKRNGVLIYSTTQPILASNVNATPMSFSFTGSDFCTDGSQDVTFTICFGLVHQLAGKSGTEEVYVGVVGYDDVTITGTCGGSVPVATATPSTCGSNGTNNNGKITLSNFAPTDKYDYVAGNTYTGTATYATATAIPTGGIIASNLPDTPVAKTYTVRVFSAAGCFTDVVVTLNPSICVPNCTLPAASITGNAATCTGTTPNNNASISLTGITGGDKVGYSAGTTYTGPAYTNATALTGSSYTLSNLPNPTGSQPYTVRIFNASNTCYVDKTVTIDENTCTPCKNIVAEICSWGATDPNSTPGNGVAGEDDQGSLKVCTDSQYIDLQLAKTVTPTSGITCPTSTTFIWTLTLQNTGNMTAQNINVTDVWPGAELLLLSVTASKGEFSGGTWSVASLAANETATLTLRTQATKAGSYTNCAYVSAAYPDNDPDSSPNNTQTANEDDDACATITVTGPNPPTLSKEFSPMNTKPNVPTRLTLKIWNNETAPVTLQENFVDNLPSSPAQMTIATTPNVSVSNGIPVVAAAGASMFFIPAGTVLPVGLTQISMDVIAPANGQYCNVIPAGALKTTSCNNIQADSACVLVNNSFVMSPIIKKAFSALKIATNQTSVLTITVENRNTVPLTLSQDFSDNLPVGLVAVGTPTSSCGTVVAANNNTVITLKAGAVLQPGTCTISVPVTSTLAGTYCNQILMNAMLTEGGGKTNLGNEDLAEACIEVVNTPVFDLALTKKLALGQSTQVLVGDTITHNIEVINQGTVTATNIQVTDYIPSSMSLVADATWQLSGSNAVLTTPIASLAAGQTVIIPIKLKIISGAAGDTLVNRAEISSATGGTDKDSTPDNNPNNDAGGRYNSPSDDSVNGNGIGTPGSRSGLTDEDDADPDWLLLTQCVNSNLAAGVILSPKAIRTQNDVVQITFGLTNPGSVPLSDITFVGQVKVFNRPNATPQTLTLTKQGDTNNDGIMQPNESWLYTGTFSSTYTPGTVFVVTGEATASCGSVTIKAATADLIYTVGVNMDVVVKDACASPGGMLNVDLITRLLIDEDMALNPGTISVAGITINLPKRRFEGRGVRIRVEGINNNQPFDPFNPPTGVTLTKFTDQGTDAGRNTNNILDEADPVNTFRAPCTALGQDDVGCEFPDWVFHMQIPVPANYTGTSFSVTASDDFQLFQSVEDPAGSNKFSAYEDITPSSGAGGADTESVAVCNSTGAKTDLRIQTQLSKKQLILGEPLSYTVKLWNESSTPASGVEVSTLLGSEVVYVSHSTTRGSYNSSTNLWTIGNVGANGDTVTLTLQTKVVGQGVVFYSSEVSKLDQQDVDSSPSNSVSGEDDMERVCLSVPISLCTGEKVEASVPTQYSGVKWYKNGSSTPIATGNVVLLEEPGTYTYTAENNSCPASGCCPIIVEAGTNCCPVQVCVPYTVKKVKQK